MRTKRSLLGQIRGLLRPFGIKLASRQGSRKFDEAARLGAYRRSGRDVADELRKMYAMFPILKEKRKDPAGATIFLVEQNAFAALGICDRGYVLETGEVKIAGTGEALLS